MSHKTWAEKIPKETRNRLWKSRPHVCGICGQQIVLKDDMNLDHIVPRSKGGSDDESNLQLSHALCNRLKGDKESFTIRKQPLKRANQHLDIDDALLFCKACKAFKRRLFKLRWRVSNNEWLNFWSGKKFWGYSSEEIKDALLRAGEVCCYADSDKLNTDELSLVKFLFKRGFLPVAGVATPCEWDAVFYTTEPIFLSDNSSLTRIHYKSKP